MSELGTVHPGDRFLVTYPTTRQLKVVVRRRRSDSHRRCVACSRDIEARELYGDCNGTEAVCLECLKRWRGVA